MARDPLLTWLACVILAVPAALFGLGVISLALHHSSHHSSAPAHITAPIAAPASTP